jgi:hypothetical protein
MHVDVPGAASGTRLKEPGAPLRGRRIVRRVLTWIAGIIGALVLTGLVLYTFGGPGGVTREVRTRYEELRAAGQAPEIEDRFVIPVPGCRCHSSDPVSIVQHSERRIRECFSCH